MKSRPIPSPISPPAGARKQGGVALVVALALVLFSTLLGVTALQVGTDDLRSVTSEERGRRAFHVAEAAANQAFKTLAPGALDRTAQTPVQTISMDSGIDVVVLARSEGLVPVVNSSLRLVARNVYAIQGTASSTDGATSRTVVLGAAQRVPMGR